ncbi:MAG: hypothetical protein VKP62_04190 [Candidatus Sericytochromatia bacterium]|nr:hypothetical protein [Candidatus Sericytochromatia bacterium]
MINTRIDPRDGAVAPENRYLQVLRVAAQHKTGARELTRASLAEAFFRENPMPWLLDSGGS